MTSYSLTIIIKDIHAQTYRNSTDTCMYIGLGLAAWIGQPTRELLRGEDGLYSQRACSTALRLGVESSEKSPPRVEQKTGGITLRHQTHAQSNRLVPRFKSLSYPPCFSQTQ